MNRILDILRSPDAVYAQTADSFFKLDRASSAFAGGGVRLEFPLTGTALDVVLTADVPVKRLRLRWREDASSVQRVLTDSWGVANGNLGWYPVIGERPLYWYFHTWDGELTHSYGVRTAPNAFCFWQLDPAGITLTLDVRSGGAGVELKAPLTCCSIVTREGIEGERPFAACEAFCSMMCQHSSVPDRPVFGLNNWYYAYGDISRESVIADAEMTARVAGGFDYAPYMVVDDGWQPNRIGDCDYIGGPWTHGNRYMGNMQELAGEINARGCLPGLWMRPLLTIERIPKDWFLQRPEPGMVGKYIDPSHPEVLAQIREDVSRIVGWGYRLIKHDFSCPDLMGMMHFDTVELTPDGWHLHDRSKPTAQVYVELYRTIQAAAGPDTLVMGCNTYNHLCAGIHQIQRSGYDTSSNWNITRRRGINCLAFRQPQNRRFFLTDADCAPFTEHSSYQLNLDFLDCVARSGSSMFASIKPGVLTDRQLDRIREVFAVGARHGNTSEAVDWMQHSTPSQYLFDGQIYTYDWYSLTDGAVIL